MRKAAVIFGTDGVSDYVQTPDGKRYSLGPVSVLTLVSGLVPSARAIRAAMNEFLDKRQVSLKVDLDEMWRLLPVRRARYSSVESYMGEGQMDKWKVEQPKQAYEVVKPKKDWGRLEIKSRMKQHDIKGEVSGSTFSWSVELPNDEELAKFKDKITKDLREEKSGKGWVLRQASIKIAADANADLVESILRRVAEAGAEIQVLEGKGYPVKAATLVKGELIRIASKVGELASGDLGSESTKTALTKLQVDLDKL